MAGGAASLFHRHGRERGRADDVAGGVHAVRGRLELVIDLDVAATRQRDARGLEIEPIDVSDTSETPFHFVVLASALGMYSPPLRRSSST